MDNIGNVRKLWDVIYYHDNFSGTDHPGIDEASDDIERSLERVVKEGEDYVVVVMPKKEYLRRYNDGR